MVRTRLDSVVQVKERAEDRAGQALARAESAVTAARAKVEEARRAASQDYRSRADVSQWELTELAHHRALTDAKKAQKDLEALQKSALTVRASYITAHQSAEVVRRVADSRREEAVRELNRVEDKALDEAASLLHFRRAS
ncbi:MAG: flagellar FliJ family protein [Archangium sp.]|nr:flagellar FliJ family protein [Archangium sp.]